MEENEKIVFEEKTEKVKKDYLLPLSILVAAVLISGSWIYSSGVKDIGNPGGQVPYQAVDAASMRDKILPPAGVVLAVNWGSLGAQMVKSGVIDAEKFENAYQSRGGLNEEAKQLLYGEENGKLKITEENSGVLLNLLWALGLGNKNEILEKGPMMDSRYGGAENFASTGGWTIAKSSAMDHYSKHVFVSLTREQQALVQEVSKNIYRPCCGNSTYFPDCNHGMAMLGLLELMASQGVGEEEMYKTALLVNSYWFPDTYLTIGKYLAKKGVAWESTGAKEILGANFSSSAGYQQILSQVEPTGGGGGSCGV